MKFYKPGFILFFILLFSDYLFSQPTISSFTPASGPVGTTVTINGTNFNATPANNIVFFGAVRATVSAATTTSLTVIVPDGATYQPLTVTTSNLTAYSSKPFVVTFSGAAPVFTSKSFEYAAHVDSIENTETSKYAIGDLDNDGRIDVATIDRTTNTLSVYRNTTITSVVSFASKLDFVTGQNPRSVSIGDINGDGKLDIIVSNLNDNTVSVFKNSSSPGAISFASKSDFATATQPSAISVTDIDQDGKADLVVNSIGLPGAVSVLRNSSVSGSVSFAPKVDIALVGVSIEELRTADIDGDGKSDILIPNYGLGTITVYRNTSLPGTISFASRIEIGAPDGYPSQLEIGDLNGDGKPDLAVEYYLGNTISVFRNASSVGSISFDSPVDFATGNYTDGIAITDLDGDGKPDMAVPSGVDSVSLFQNSSSVGGAITFHPIVKFPAPFNSPILTGDFNGDGTPDISLLSGMFIVTIWKNKTNQPQVILFTPASANPGATITIQGQNFSGIASVSFGGVPASSFIIVNATTIKAVVDTGASGDVAVSGPLGLDSQPGFIFTAPPIVKSFSPTSAATGEIVTISGKYFLGTSAVNFGGTPATSFTVVNANTITAVVGSGVSGSVSVTNQFGTDSLTGFTYIPVPTITSFSPTLGGLGTTIAITGTNLSGATIVSFGGVLASSFTVLSPTSIQAVVGAGLSGNVSVTTPFGTASLAGFNFAPAPIILSFTPQKGSTGTLVTITGTNLDFVNDVQFGGVSASGVTVLNSTTVQATVGGGASGIVSVISPYGSSSSTSKFIYRAAPIIDSISPTSGPVSTTVTLYGKYFDSTNAVYFDGLSATSFTVISDSVLKAVSSYGYSGPIQVTNDLGFTLSNTSFYFNYPAPTISSFTPTSGLAGAQINITGNNFLPGGLTQVSFGNVPATSVTVNSSTSITATVGAGASGDVSVTTPGGAALMSGFVYLLPPPVVTSINPGIGGEGMAVAISGSGFTDITAVSFGGIPAKSFVVTSPYTITAIVDTGASGNVSVTNANGTGTWSSFVYAPVTVTSFTPTSGSKDSVIEITGSGFDNLIPGFYNVTGVYFGGVPASSFHVNSTTSITATVGPGNSGPVTVTTQWLSGSKDGFSYTTSSTAISSVSPMVGGAGETVTINGFGFSGATSVTVGGIPVASFTVNSANNITATLGQGSSGTVIVNSPGGTASFDGFIFTYAPVIASVNPGAAMAGTYVTLVGSNFSPIASNNLVYFGGTKADVVSASTTSLVVSVPVGATYSYISVTSNHLTGYSKTKFKSLFLADETISSSSFDARIDSLTGSNPTQVNVSDFNRDGKTDVMVCNPGAGYGGAPLVVDFQNSSSPNSISFLPKNIIQYSDFPLNSAIADIDGDGKMDLIITNGGDGRNVSVLQNTTTGNAITFGNEILVGSPAGVETNDVTCADLDMDGKPDIITSGAYGPGIGIYRNTTGNGNISFSPMLLNIGSIPSGVFAADVDMDGKPELIVRKDGQILILRNTSSPGNISFSSPLTYPVLSNPGIAIGDIDGDEKNDILVCGSTFSLFKNSSSSGNILLDNRKDIFISPNPYSIEFGDINGDGKPDVAMVISDSSKMSIWPNTSSAGSISFGERIDLATGHNPASVSIADIDLDQRPDLIVTNYGSGTVSFLRNRMRGYFLNSFSPSHGPSGTSVTIKGSNLSNVTEVSFGGMPAASFTIVDSTTITAVVGVGSSGDVSVTTPGGVVSLSGFTYDIVTAVGNINGNSNELKIFPNPANDYIVAEHPSTNRSASLRLVDMFGRVMTTISIVRNSNKTQLNTTRLAAGVYKIIWSDGNNSLTKTVVIAR